MIKVKHQDVLNYAQELASSLKIEQRHKPVTLFIIRQWLEEVEREPNPGWEDIAYWSMYQKAVKIAALKMLLERVR